MGKYARRERRRLAGRLEAAANGHGRAGCRSDDELCQEDVELGRLADGQARVAQTTVRSPSGLAERTQPGERLVAAPRGYGFFRMSA